MSWATLFDRAAAADVSLAAVRDVLAARRAGTDATSEDHE